MRGKRTFILLWILAGVCLVESSSLAAVAGYPDDEAFLLGQKIYRQGLLPSGEPVQAIVQGDIPVDGTAFTCESCHLRAGLGSVEGTVITLPTNSTWLMNPRPSVNAWRLLVDEKDIRPTAETLPDFVEKEDIRPAYDDRSLAEALRKGIDPKGRQLSLTMPLYDMSDGDMELLIHYLKNLSAEYSPGVTEETIHVATVIADGVGESERYAMLKVLETTVESHNNQWRFEKRRDERGPFYRQEMNVGYRTITLHVWNLTGPRDTWAGQLEEHYRKQPVFVLLAGIVTGDWSPVHEFSERNGVPCLFPLTDLPVISSTDWYTLYYSKGMYQEGEAAAKYLRRAKDLPEGSRVIQLYRRGTKGEATARGFREIWERSRREPPQEVVLDDGMEELGKAWKEAAGGPGPAVVLAWVEEKDLEEIVRHWEGGSRPSRIFLSAGLLGDAVYSVPEPMRGETYFAYPYLLPRNGSKSRLVVTTWLKVRKIEMVDFEIQAKMYFLGWILPENLHMIRHLWYRDYLLDVLDMRWDENYAIAVYPALTFGPGQRYGSKSCYIVQLGPGDEPEIIPRSQRVIH